MNSKRGREDGDISRYTYDENVHNTSSSSSLTFGMADSNQLANRRLVKPSSNSSNSSTKRDKYLHHISMLNSSFQKHIASILSSSSSSSHAVPACNDYLSHMKGLQDVYNETRGEVITFGSGDCGQLGMGMDEDECFVAVNRPRIVVALRNFGMSAISTGGLHTAAVTAAGAVYTWGCNDDGGVGRTGEDYLAMEVTSSDPNFTKVINVGCGDCHTVAVTEAGSAYIWGSYKDKEGKIFSDAVKKDPNTIRGKKLVPHRVEGVDNAVEIQAGANFNAARLEDGGILTWGLGETGELGRGPPLPTKFGENYNLGGMVSEHLTPLPCIFRDSMNVKPFVVKVACGAHHLLVIAVGGSNGRGKGVWTSGLNNYGQLGFGMLPNGEKDKDGHPEDTKNRSVLERIKFLDGKEICDIDGGNQHSLCVDGEGNCWSWGRGDSGQLGNSDKCPAGYFLPNPAKVQLPPPSHLPRDSKTKSKVKSVSCGSNHNLVLTENNDVFTWGYGDMLALGHGKEKDENRPKLLKINQGRDELWEIKQVKGGGQHSGMICVVKKK